MDATTNTEVERYVQSNQSTVQVKSYCNSREWKQQVTIQYSMLPDHTSLVGSSLYPERYDSCKWIRICKSVQTRSKTMEIHFIFVLLENIMDLKS
jgi:hypothetical protein